MQLPWDILVQERLSNLLRKVLSSAAVKASLGPNGQDEVVPGTNVVPANATLAQWTEWYKTSISPVWHAVGSAGMRRREWGGVVDEKFRVYGVEGLRVVDASVIVMEVNGNPTSTIYALAELAAEEILKERKQWVRRWI
jgi:choline dehydrogenase-like flavoprotein